MGCFATSREQFSDRRYQLWTNSVNRNHWRTGQEDTRMFSKNAVENSNVQANEGLLRDALQKEFLGEADSTRYLLPERPFPPPDEIEPHLGYARQIPKYPLPQCYTNDSGFMCCNSKLEQVMKQVFDELASDNKWNRCNAQKLANNLQDDFSYCLFGSSYLWVSNRDYLILATGEILMGVAGAPASIYCPSLNIIIVFGWPVILKEENKPRFAVALWLHLLWLSLRPSMKKETETCTKTVVKFRREISEKKAIN
uniref:Uncharacterized protein n=1 Tax=Angiostrongylus cantonensis TaxID=6313 RepID=A0A0K0CV27_ANGCA